MSAMHNLMTTINDTEYHHVNMYSCMPWVLHFCNCLTCVTFPTEILHIKICTCTHLHVHHTTQKALRGNPIPPSLPPSLPPSSLAHTLPGGVGVQWWCSGMRVAVVWLGHGPASGGHRSSLAVWHHRMAALDQWWGGVQRVDPLEPLGRGGRR